MDYYKDSFLLERIFAKATKTFFKVIKKVPGVETQIQKEKDKVVKEFKKKLYSESRIYEIPSKGADSDTLLAQIKTAIENESKTWKNGRVSGAVYVPTKENEKHMKFVNEIFSICSLTNPLHADIFPTVRKIEADVISMTCSLLNGGVKTVCGAMTSGGTESILMAVKSYRDARSDIINPEMIIPITAHCAFDKAAHYFKVKVIHAPITKNYQVDVNFMKNAINKNTIMLVGSAPNFPHGIIDPIEDIAKLAKSRGIGMHVDGCLGGFMLPFLRKLGYDLPPFDFSIDGVTSMSADTHKYGYAPKGTSVILFRNTDIRKYMFFSQTDWPGGLYASPTMAGSRSGAVVAACWASLMFLGQESFMKYAKIVADAREKMVMGIKEISGLYVLGQPKAMVVAWSSDTIDIYRLADGLHKKGWNLNALHKPKCMHICITALWSSDVVDKFLIDLRESSETLIKNPNAYEGGVAPMYGIAASLPDRSIVNDILISYVDALLDT